MMDLLVVQGLHAPNFAGLISVLQPNDRSCRVQYALASTLPQFVSGRQIATSAHALHECHWRTCTIRQGRTLIPFDANPVHAMTDGDTFTLQGRDRAAAHGNETENQQGNQNNADEQIDDEDMDVEQSPPSPHHEDDPPSPSNSDSGRVDDQALHVMRLGHPTVFGHVDWRSYHVVLREAAQLVGLPTNQFVGYHYTQVPLVGQALKEEAIILQHVNDIRVGSNEKLIDVVMHVNRHAEGIPEAPTINRKVYKVLPQVARPHILRTAGVDAYCQWMDDQCVVHCNGHIWHFADGRLRDVEHGTYIRIQLPPPIREDWEPSLAIRMAQEAGDLFDFPLAGRLAHDLLQGQSGDANHEAEEREMLRSRQCKPCENVDDPGVPIFYAPGTRAPRLRPRHDGEFAWWYQLGALFTQYAEQETIDGDAYMYVQTWFIHHESKLRCRHPRPARLDGSTFTWIEELRFIWRDQLDREHPFSIHLVQPRPPQSRFENYACHVILEQARPPGLRAGVVTTLYEGPTRDAFEQQAASLPRFARKDQIIDDMHLGPFCEGRRCDIKVGLNNVQLVVPVELINGFNLCIRIGTPLSVQQLPHAPGAHFEDVAFLMQIRSDLPTIPIPRLPWDGMRSFEEMDIIHLMQRQISRRGRPSQAGADMNLVLTNCPAEEVDEAIYGPASRSVLLLQDEFVQALQLIWEAQAFAWEGEQRTGKILTWFVDHREGLPVCLAPRPVSLQEDYTHWHAAIHQTWAYLVDDSLAIEYHIVNPTPSFLEPNIMAHIVVIQAPQPDVVTSVVTIFDPWLSPRPGPYTRLAVTTPEQVQQRDLVHVTSFAERCFHPASAYACELWHGEQQLLPEHSYQGRNGNGYDLYVVVREGKRFGLRSHAEWEDDSITLLQRSAVKQQAEQASSARCQWPPTQQTVCFLETFKAFDQFDTHHFLPVYDLQQVAAPHPAAEWTAEWWDHETPGDIVCIYVDGSYCSCPQEGDVRAGAAVAGFLHTSRGWVFLGALSSAIETASSAYTAELYGSIAAHKFIYDVLKLHKLIEAATPQVILRYDALTVGNQAAGHWSSITHRDYGSFLRALALLVETKYHTSIQFEHVHGHSGEIGNDLVDQLANEARSNGGLTPFARWIDHQVHTAAHAQAHWFWLLFAPEYRHLWHGLDLCVPAPKTEPTPAVVPTDESAAEQATGDQIIDIHIRLVTCNVLSLKGSKDVATQMTGIARQAALTRQMKEEAITIFAFQETRLRKLHQAHDEDFFIFKSAATEAGHLGIMMGFAKHRPYGLLHLPNGRRQAQFFRDEHFAIVAFDPRFLLVRVTTPHLKFVAIAAHAPHTGHSQEAVATWWEELQHAIPQQLRNWPVVLMCDANAMVGSEPSIHIGDHQAGKSDDRALPFEAFVVRNDLWLPSTFSTCQRGEGQTWVHSTGSSRRIDYVGLPRGWHTSQCTAWISEVIDPTILRADHAAACVDCHFQLATYSREKKQASDKLRDCNPNNIDWTGLTDPLHFEVDVHTHFQTLHDQVVQHLRPQCRKRARRPLKQTLSEETWALVCEKAKWRKQLKEYNFLQR